MRKETKVKETSKILIIKSNNKQLLESIITLLSPILKEPLYHNTDIIKIKYKPIYITSFKSTNSLTITK